MRFRGGAGTARHYYTFARVLAPIIAASSPTARV
jgi:hypothetical protein